MLTGLSPSISEHTVNELLSMLLRHGEVIEVRIKNKYVVNGYYNDWGKLLEAVAEYDGKANMYVTVNPVRRELLYAAFNEVRRPAIWMSRNVDVTRRATLIARFSHANSDIVEALHHAESCRDFLTQQGWPEPSVARNGYSIDLLYAVNLPNTNATTALINNVLTALNRRFGDEHVTVDTTACEAAYLMPLYGAAVAEDSHHTAILYLPNQMTAVDATQLNALVNAPLIESTQIVDDNPIRQFVAERCVLESEAWTPTGILFSGYRVYCHERGLEPVVIGHFARWIVAAFGLEAVRRKVRGIVTRGIRGIRLR